MPWARLSTVSSGNDHGVQVTLAKKVERWVPTAVTPVMITSEMRPAIKAYSIAVAPDSVLTCRTRDRAAWE